MRLFAKQLIHVIPNKFLVNQVRETIIVAQMTVDNKRNFIIDRAKTYPLEHLASYFELIIEETDNRHFNVSQKIN